MADDDNPLEGGEFENALATLNASASPEMKAVATLITSLRDAVLELQEQGYAGEDEDEEDDDD